MYWYKSKISRLAALICCIALPFVWYGCKPDIKNNSAFDIKGYFTKDTAYLNKLNKPVTKTVYHNGVTETKRVHIDDWGQELSLFIDADINKPAWVNSYTIINEGSLLVYRAKDPALKVRELIIKKEKQKVKWMLIYTKTENILYKTTRRLTYYPDSLYEIVMEQKVKLMKKNVYKIQGLIGK